MGLISRLTCIVLCILAVYTISTAGTVLLINNKLQKCLRALGGLTAPNNAGLELVGCACPVLVWNDQVWSEQWHTGSVNSTLFNLVNGKCITVNEGAVGNRVIINQYNCVGVDHQLWQIYNGAYAASFQIRNALTGQCLTPESGGSIINQYNCLSVTDAPHQFWSLVQYS